MRRGDVVTVVIAGEYGKPRPSVVVQSDALPEDHASIVVCPMTSEVAEASTFRVTVQPSEGNGLRALSQVMCDKPIAVVRGRIGTTIGSLDASDLRRIDNALAFALDLSL